MPQDLHQQSREQRSRLLASPREPRVRTMASIAGISLERDVPTAEVHDYIRESDNVVWMDVQDPGPAELAMLVDEFGFHPLALEGVERDSRRPKVDEFQGYGLLVTCSAILDPAGGEPGLPAIDMLIGRNYVVTLHRGPVPALDEAALRWTRGGKLLSEGVGFLVYAILDAVVDSFAPVIDQIEEEIAESEIAVFGPAPDEGLRTLLRLKRTLIALRRVLYPMREMFPLLVRPDRPQSLAHMEVYLRDVSSHVLRILDALDTEREMVTSALEATLTVSANRLNNTMKTLAVITVAMAVVGSVFGAYGMNFASLPFDETPGGFWIVSVGTVGLVIGALAFGKWRRWW